MITIARADVRHRIKQQHVEMARKELARLTEKLAKLPEKKATAMERKLIQMGIGNAQDTLDRAAEDERWPGWRSETCYVGPQQLVRLIGPDGTSYLPTTYDSERVDVELVGAHGQVTRWKLEREAAVTKKQRKVDKLVKQGTAAAAAKRAARKAQQPPQE